MRGWRPATEGAALRRFLTVINLLGAAVVASAFIHPHLLIHPSPLRLGTAALAFTVGELALLHIRIGDENHSFTWSEAAMIIGLVLVPSPWARLIGPVCVALVHVWFRRPLVKVAFNAFSFATALFLARTTFNLVGGVDPHIDQIRTWGALGLASFVFFLWNGGTVAAAVAMSQGLRFRDVYRQGLALSSFVWLGNTTFGVVVVTAGAHDRRLLSVVPLFLVFLYVADRGYLRAMEERDQWRFLQQASARLVCVDGDALMTHLIEGARDVMRADFVELVVSDEAGEATRYRSSGGGERSQVEGSPAFLIPDAWGRLADAERTGCFLRRTGGVSDKVPARRVPLGLDGLGLATALAAPLVDGSGAIGLLTVGWRRNQKITPRRHHVLSTFASQATTALGNARLFAAASEERAKLEQIVDNTSDGIFLVDSFGVVASWNTAMARITGRSAAETVGRPLFEGINAADEQGRVAGFEWLQRVRESADPGSAVVSVTPPGSELRWLNLSIAPVRGGDRDSLVVVARDVTSLREADEAKQEFVATVSHELRTPLTPLKGFLLTLLRDDFKPTPKQLDEILHRMLQQSERLESLIEDLLNMSRLERGEFRIDPEPVDLDEVIEGVLAERPRPISRSGTQHVSVMADSGRLVQVLTNLLSNAEKYSPAEGAIDVSVSVLEARAGEGGGVVEIEVRDEGPGIPEDQREAVFDRFRRLGHHLTREQGGTGLGLYIARRLVESMGGRIWVEGGLGSGSTFVFTLPLATMAEVNLAEAKARKAAVKAAAPAPALARVS